MQNALKWIPIAGGLLAAGALLSNYNDLVRMFDKMKGTVETVEIIEPKVGSNEQDIDTIEELLEDHAKRFEAQDSEQLESDMRLLRECMKEEPEAQDRVRRAYCQQLEIDYLGTE